jgi:hypothetical protein
MATEIHVEKMDEEEFLVRVAEGKSSTMHRVTLRRADCDRLAAGKIGPSELVRRSFEFLLENEPKESILPRFELTVISRYFPDFEHEMKRRLAGLT